MNEIYNNYYNTRLPLLKEIGYNIMKDSSMFRDDSGVDYDLRGYYDKHGSFIPENIYGHINDEFKKPIHPTFSIYSRYYNGQPYAVDWNKEPYKTLSELNIL